MDQPPPQLVQHPVPRPWSFTSDTWDPNWLFLVCHYINQLRWPSNECPSPGKVSLIELMLDLFITYQTLGPLNVRTMGGKFLQDVPKHAQKSKLAYYFLPSPSQAKQLPNPLLVHCSSTFLRTFDFLSQAGAITVQRANVYCMGQWGYNNVVPAIRMRPPLLSGNLVSELLSSTLIPGARSLRYTLRIPVVAPKPYPLELRAWGESV